MNRYNFKPSLDDHCSLLILVRPCHGMPSRDVAYILQKLNELSSVAVGASGRILTLKFVRSLAKDHLDWHKLQAHRRLVGLIGLAHLPPDPKQHQAELEKINNKFNSIKIEFQTYLFDSRCVILKSSDQEVPPARKEYFVLNTEEEGIPADFQSFCNDFVTSLFSVLEAKRLKAINEKLENMPLPIAPIELEHVLSDADARTQKHCRIIGRNYKLRGDICLLSGLNQDALYNYYHASETLKPINDFLWRGVALEGLCVASCAMRGKLDRDLRSPPLLIVKTINANIGTSPKANDDLKSKTYTPLSDEELVNKYTEALGCYRKFNSVGPVDVEAHLKFINFLLRHKKKLEVCQVLQSFLSLMVNFNTEEKIERHKVVSGIYTELHLYRKAAFFNRLAALCPRQKKSQAYTGLLTTASGYGLDLVNCKRQDKGDSWFGWPSIQLRILQELKHVSNDRWTTVKLMCFLLEKYQDHLTEQECGEMVTTLEDYSAGTEDKDGSSSDGNCEERTLIRPLPIVRTFKPRKLAHHLRAFRLTTDALKNTGPFIFSSLSYRPTAKVPEEVVQWVCNDVAEVGMTVENPLPAEIKVNKMMLITEGASFEAFPATLALPALSGSFPFMLLGIPTNPGTLTIKGYTVDLFGIESTVHLDEPITVDVSTPLPLLELTSNLSIVNQLTHSDPDDDDYQTLFTCVSLYNGHSYTAEISIENVGKLPVHWIGIKTGGVENDALIEIDSEILEKELPLQPGSKIMVSVIVMPPLAWQLHSGADRYQASVKLQYSNDSSDDVSIVRNIAMMTDIKIIPSLYLSEYELYEIERHPSCCCVTFKAENLTSVPMNVVASIGNTTDIKVKDLCPISDEVDIEPKSAARMCIHLPRFQLEIDKTKKKLDIEGMFCAAVKEAVSLKWRLSESSYHGLSYWHNFAVTEDLVAILKPKHLDIALRIRDEVINEGRVLKMDRCQVVTIQVQLTNVHDDDLHNLLLNVHPSQEHCADLTAAPARVASMGILTKNIKTLSPGEVFEHSCGLMFLFGGSFHVDVICCVDRHPSGAHSTRSRAQAMINDFPAIRRRTLSQPQTHVIEDGDWWRSVDSPPRTMRDGYQLRKPIHDFWCRSFCVDVQ